MAQLALPRLALAAASLSILACGGTVEVGEDVASVRFINLSGDSPALDATVDGTSPDGLAAVAFGESTGYADIEVGPRQLALGSAPSTEVELEVLRYTVVALGDAASLQTLVFADDDTGLDPAQARVRAIHAAPGVGEVDILQVATDGTSTDLASNLGFGDASAAIDLDAGDPVIGVDVDDDGVSDIYFELPSLAAGSLANVYITEDVDDSVVVYAQQAGNNTTELMPAQASLRVLHASRDLGPVNAMVGAVPVALNLGFGESSDSVSAQAGVYNLAAESGALGSGLVDVSLFPGAHTWVIYGDSVQGGTQTLTSAVIADAAEASDGNIRFKVFHAAPDIEEGDVYSLNSAGGADTNLVPDLGFGGVGETPELVRAPTDLGFEANSSGLIIATFSLPSLTVSAANVFIIQDAPGSVYLLAQLVGSNTALVCEASATGPCTLP